MIDQNKSDQQLFLKLNKIAIPDPYMTWAKYLNMIHNADKELLCASPVRFDLEIDSNEEKRVMFFVGISNRDGNVSQYGALAIGFNVNKRHSQVGPALRIIHYICVETGARIREAYYGSGENVFNKFLMKYRSRHPNIVKRINTELQRIKVINKP